VDEVMNPDLGTSLQTRASLLQRLKTGQDEQSWEEFYRIYGGLIRWFAERSGLTAEEAEEVVQETAIGVAKGLPNYVYDPARCRFRTWLLKLTRWRVLNQIRKRPKLFLAHDNFPLSSSSDERPPDSRTATIERIPDPAEPQFGAEWDAALEANLLKEALERVRPKLDALQYQAFDLLVLKEWPAADVAKTLGISAARAYLYRHRVSALLKKEVLRLERRIESRLKKACSRQPS
jgi:RNA polymerase sigma-70 factor (ECF subfamily)